MVSTSHPLHSLCLTSTLSSDTLTSLAPLGRVPDDGALFFLRHPPHPLYLVSGLGPAQHSCTHIPPLSGSREPGQQSCAVLHRQALVSIPIFQMRTPRLSPVLWAQITTLSKWHNRLHTALLGITHALHHCTNSV